MCIAVVQPAGKTIPTPHLRSCFQSNPDGAGIAYVKDGKVMVVKGLMKESQLLAAYDQLRPLYGVDNAMLVHCRIATAGKVSKDNCHPFRIKGGAMIHNGHLWSVDKGIDGIKSDTREFAEIFYNILDYDSVKKAVDSGEFTKVIGTDKMAMLYDDGSWATAGRWNEDEDTGIHYSNYGYSYKGDSYYDTDFYNNLYWD